MSNRFRALDIEDIDREFGYIIQTYEKTLKGDK